jgi:YaiO family outer membrane protein
MNPDRVFRWFSISGKPSDLIRGLVFLCLVTAVGMSLSAQMSLAQTPSPAPGQSEGQVLAPETPPDPPLKGALEVGGGFAQYSDDMGRADGEFLRATFSRPWRYSLVLDGGREARFGETSYGGGVTYTRFLPGRTNFSIGLSSGTGEFLAPRYRLGASFSGSVLSVVTTVGYLRTQSKAENSSDGYSLGLLRYTGHWILGASGRLDVGHPGNTKSTTWGAGLTYYVWRETYIGVSADFGDVSYMLVGKDKALVDYDSKGYNLGISQWLTSNAGFNLKLSYGETSFYNVRGATISLFREW